jgi:hypothetical protein
MKILSILLAILVLLIGLRLILTAAQAAISGKILVRQGFRSTWQPAPNRNEVWKLALRDGLLGLLLMVLGAVMIF